MHMCVTVPNHSTISRLTQHGGVGVLGLHARWQWFDCVRLSCKRQHAFPGTTVGVHGTRRGRHQLWNRQEHHAVVAESDGEPGEAGHGSVDGVLCQLHTVQTVGGIGWHGSNGVGWIDVFDGGSILLLCEVVLNLLLHEFTDRWQLAVASSVLLFGHPQHLLSCTFCHHDNSVALILHATSEMWQASLLALQHDRDLGHEAQVHVAR
mmetsp:Transcript_9463/g.25697  ORF Transcript_9463/g.25697 Transcript_9463/m.25697 type:complete len:207 (+) Transcript_9463:475-1095(+)